LLPGDAPFVDLPLGAEGAEGMCVAIGNVDSYDFHALEVIQCMAERRKGGETGVAAGTGEGPAKGPPSGCSAEEGAPVLISKSYHGKPHRTGGSI